MIRPVLLSLSLFAIIYLSPTQAMRIGVGRADITGPIVEIGFMGYAQISQRGTGLHLRQFSRAFIFDDGTNRLVFVSADCAMIPHSIKKEVVNQLQKEFGLQYTISNVMISCTHTHSTPGGYMQDLLFDLTTLGFIRATFNSLVSGITRSITRAHSNMQFGRLQYVQGEILDVNINRSPTSYLNNPKSERDGFKYDVDKTITQLQLVSTDGDIIGLINWFAVHATSMNNTNKFVSSDNVGYASLLLESLLEPGKLPARTDVVATFASSNLGDVSPNTKGPRCQITGDECDLYTSRCKNPNELCVSFGPGKDMMESTLIIAQRLANKAKELSESLTKDILVTTVDYIHQFIRPADEQVIIKDPQTKTFKIVNGCVPAMGYSFAAGTTDGPGSFSFQQSMKSSNMLWNLLRNFLAKPTNEDVACHAPKPILLATGRMDFPFEWQPEIASTHLARLGNFVIACVPGEFTTMSGRRMREILKEKFGEDSVVVIAGLCNMYTDYITTPEEYMSQRYEAASTIFGPYTLPIYLQQYDKLAHALLKNKKLPPGPEPSEVLNDILTLQTPVVVDYAKPHAFGDCLEEPQDIVQAGDVVLARFVAGNPRNNLMHEKSFLLVEKKVFRDNVPDFWKVVATDASWNTKLYWERTSLVLATSEVVITWEVPKDVQYGYYRIRHFGYYKDIIKGIFPYSGSTRLFEVNYKRSNSMEYEKKKKKYGPR